MRARRGAAPQLPPPPDVEFLHDDEARDRHRGRTGGGGKAAARSRGISGFRAAAGNLRPLSQPSRRPSSPITFRSLPRPTRNNSASRSSPPTGFAYGIGAAEKEFSIQSISKPIVYGLAMQDHGRDHVLRKIGVEPSGDPFNSITFDERANRPFNPMVNAGAIAATSLVKGGNAKARFDRILKNLRAVHRSGRFRSTTPFTNPNPSPAIATAPSPISNSTPG